MNAKKNYSLADIIDIALASMAQATGPVIDVESRYVSTQGSIPMPVKAIFNLKTEDMVAVLDDDGNPVYELGENKTKRLVKRAKTLEKPILASKVFFDDGSWTVVKNSGEDTVDVEEKKLSDGKTVKVATDASKERAIAYAVVKRVFGRVDPVTREVKGANLGRRFEKVIAASIDQNVVNTKEKIRKADKNADKNVDKKPIQKAKPKKTACMCSQIDEKSIKDTLDLLGALVKKLNPGEDSDGSQQGA